MTLELAAEELSELYTVEVLDSEEREVAEVEAVELLMLEAAELELDAEELSGDGTEELPELDPVLDATEVPELEDRILLELELKVLVDSETTDLAELEAGVLLELVAVMLVLGAEELTEL